ncbi:MAG: hypothetical protein AB7F23_10265, partial [Phycisphaerae bacterium]
RRMAQQLVCGTNLKGLGTACILYANDNDEDLPIAGGKGENTWATNGFVPFALWDDPQADWSGDDQISVSASLYLLVREADVAPKQFVCPSSDQFEFTGQDISDDTAELTDVWDFGHDKSTSKSECPKNCVSYSYHFPYEFPKNSGGNMISYALTASSTSSMAIMADRSPWYDADLSDDSPSAENWIGTVAHLGGTKNQPDSDDWDDGFEKWEKLVNNSNAHQREGQNVLFIDGHASFEKRADCAAQNDNIYAPYMGPDASTWNQYGRRIGVASPGRDPGKISKGPWDSEDNWLVNDSVGGENV